MEDQGVDESASTEPVEMVGQEAVLVENSSDDEIERTKKKKKKTKRRSFFRKTKGGGVDKGVAGHSKTRVVLIPDESMKQRSAEKAKQSRMLLEAALDPASQTSGEMNDDHKEQMIKDAFQCAVESRRLFEGDAYEDVETVVTQNTDKGEIAAEKALTIMAARKSPTHSISDKVEGRDEGEAKETPKDAKDKKWLDEAEKYVEVARIHLEKILPAFECVPDGHDFFDDQPFVPTSGIVTNEQDNATLSTIGFDNTFQEEPSLSITSLNEILDGPMSPMERKVDKSVPMSSDLERSESPGRKFFKKKKGAGKEKEKSAVASDEEKPVERFVATVVEKEEEASVSSELTSKSELERLQAMEFRTDSKLKEAMDADDTGSVVSWNGVPVLPPDDKDEKEKKGSKKHGKVEDVDDDSRSGRVKQEKPQFIEAPDNDPSLLALLAWNHMEKGDEEGKFDSDVKDEEQDGGQEPEEEGLEPEDVVGNDDGTTLVADETKPKKHRGFGWRKNRRSKKDELSAEVKGQDEQEPAGGVDTNLVTVDSDKQDVPLAEGAVDMIPDHPGAEIGDVEKVDDEDKKEVVSETFDTMPTQDDTTQTDLPQSVTEEENVTMTDENSVTKTGDDKRRSRGKRLWRPFSKKKLAKENDPKTEESPTDELLDRLKVGEEATHPDDSQPVETQS